MPNRLLLADGDPKSLRVLEVSLRNAGFQVTTAEGGAAAWEAIQRDAPDVIIADTDLPELDGLTLCARVRGGPSEPAIPFILLGADKTVEARIRGLQAGADDYLVKPTYVNEVIARVRALVQRRERDKLSTGDAPAEAFQGKLSDITVADLLELVGSNRRSGIIHLNGPRGATATVYFRQGVVVDAEVGRLSGADAIGRLFAWTEGSFDIEWKNIRRPDAIGRSTADLVLEGMKRLDEKNRVAADHPDLNGVYEVNYRVLAERLAEIPDEVNGILRLFNGSRRLAQVVEDSQLPDLEAMTVVARLRDEGIILEVKTEQKEDGSGPVPLPRSGDGPSARNGSGAVRRPVRAAVGSGPVEQSFADRMRAQARAGGGPGGSAFAPATADSPAALVPPPPPPPPPTTTKTDRGFPRLDVPEATPTPGDSDARDEPIVLQRPGSAVLESGGRAADGGGDPGTRGKEDNVIPFPAEARVSSPHQVDADEPREQAAPPPALSDEMSPEELAALFNSAAIASSPEPISDSGESSADNAVPKVPVSMLQTQRGYGLAPPPPPARPSTDAEAAAGTAATAASPEPAAPPALPVAPVSAGTADGGGAVVSVDPASEATVQYKDRVLERREALDELGVAGRGRALKIIAAALVAGAVGAVLVNRFRAPHADAPAVVASAESEKSAARSAPAIAAPAEDLKPKAPLAAAAQPSSKDLAKAGPDEAAEGRPDQAPGKSVKAAEGKPAGATVAEPPVRPAEKAGENDAKKGLDPAPNKGTLATADEVAKAGGDKRASGSPGTISDKAGDARKAADAQKASESAARPPAETAANRSVADLFRQKLAECHALFSKNRFREAGAACSAAVEGNPRSADALTMLAHVELNRGHMGRAYELAQKAISIYPDQPDAYVIIGGVHQDGGRNDQAKAAYQRYLHLAPHGRYADELRSIVGSL